MGQIRGREEELSRDVPRQELPGNSKLNLSKAMRMVDTKTRPCLLLSLDEGGEVKGMVPSHLVSQDFTAEKWLQEAGGLLKSSVSAPRGQDSAVHCNMKGVKLENDDRQQISEQIMDACKYYVENKFKV